MFATRERMRHAERELAQQAEASYTRMVSDWQAARPQKTKPAEPKKAGASVTAGRAYKALEGHRRAADHEPLTSALRHVLDSRPPAA